MHRRMRTEFTLLSPQVYKRRWYIAILYALFAFSQNGMWNTWGPIDHTAIFLYGW